MLRTEIDLTVTLERVEIWKKMLPIELRLLELDRIAYEHKLKVLFKLKKSAAEEEKDKL